MVNDSFLYHGVTFLSPVVSPIRLPLCQKPEGSSVYGTFRKLGSSGQGCFYSQDAAGRVSLAASQDL